MRPQRPRPRAGARVVLGSVALATVVAASGCSAPGFSDSSETGPPRITPNPQPEVAAAMVEGRPDTDVRLNACELLDLSTERLIELTDADMPEVDPIGSGDLGLLCTYGGPGSPALYEMQQSESQQSESEQSESQQSESQQSESQQAETEPLEVPDPAETTTDVSPTPTPTPTTATTTAATAQDERDYVPDTFAAGAVKPPGGPQAALGGQAALLGARYACSEIRGTQASTVEASVPAAPEAPAPVQPQLGTAYIDCTADPTGGGVEVHTILVADNDLWHVTLISPETSRSPETEARALAGLHRVAQTILT
ncbi:hypothetical protein [Dietzia sp. PP-33]|jgi:hypothetical protein|uniref:hypothetical protein n=1 Tax=Dietzia sp. PP-33 TaxID=2957500 RepID=UPI0029B43059|nr:hypothetical protein [Dietzia sp. PP-33]MDX2356305.1 hypothetical protein [Dietzia sp. PP-33]